MATDSQHGVSGPYVGTYTASELPGEQLRIFCFFRQTDNVLLGTYYTSSGVYGTGHGLLTGNEAEMSWHNSPSSGCPGVYKGIYTFEDDTVTWKYVGVDCLKEESGEGQAQRLDGFG